MAMAMATAPMEREVPGEAMDRERLLETLAPIVGRLEKEADNRVSKRDLIEDRWLEDLRQYHGQYDLKVQADLKERKKSQLFINKTRPKTNSAEARLSDMLFPTDDKNWGISPTPVPKLAEQANDGERDAIAAVDQANAAMEGGDGLGAQAIVDQGNDASTAAQQAQAIQEAAKKAAKAMETEMADQLEECQYAIQARDVIHDACVVGTGIMKGPILHDRVRPSWKKAEEENGEYALGNQQDHRPAYRRVDYWNFFPDMDARTIEESEGFFERHLLNKSEMRALAKRPGYIKEAVRQVLRQNPSSSLPVYRSQLRAITGDQGSDTQDRYMAWEYHGPIEPEEYQALCDCTGSDPSGLTGEDGDGEIDPLVEIHVTIWFCQGEVLMFAAHPMDSNDPIYSTFCYEKDDTGPFGFGVPYLMRDPQRALNGAWRMMMDNSGLSSGPQIEIDTEVLEPVDGVWTLEPRKLWKRKSNAPRGAQGIYVHEISSHQMELAGIIQLSDQFIDDVTSMPVMAQGEQGATTTQTAHGMSILMNSVNVQFRRIVKNWDDDMTVPNVRRLYDWNMQHSTKESIKGDYDVAARGTSVLLVREIQSQNLMVMAMNFSAHPVLGPLTKVAPLYRKLVQSHMLSADEIVMTEDEILEMQRQAEEQEPPPDYDMMKLEMAQQIAMTEMQGKLQIAEMEHQTAMVRLSSEQEISISKIQAMLAEGQAARESKERTFAIELAQTRQQSPEQSTGGGSF